MSLTNGDVYVGSTEDINNRVRLHNLGKVKSTKANKPWRLVDSYEFKSRSGAVQMERFLKTGQQKEILRKKYGAVAK